MAYDPYRTGTVSSSGTAVTGVGTAWVLAGILPGDSLEAEGLSVSIKEVPDATHLVLEYAWPGTDLSSASYIIRKDSPLRNDATLAILDMRRLITALTDAGGVVYYVSGAAPDDAFGEDGQFAWKVETGALRLWERVAGEWVDQGIVSGTGYLATSTTSNTIAASGSKTFTTQDGLAYSAGARVRVTSGANWMEGVVTAYSGTTLTFTADLSNGSGTFASWTINLAGQRGATGATGPGYGGTSTTSNTIASSGSKTFTTQSGLAYTVGARVRASSGANWMEGVVTAYSGTTLTFTADKSSGSGTLATWNINAAGEPGATGDTGTGYLATSTTSNTIASSGTKTFTTQANLAYTAGARVRATSGSNWMEGVVSSYSGTTLAFVASKASGSGTFTSWNINLAGEPGDTAGAVQYDVSQSLTSPQQAQARTNIGAEATANKNAANGYAGLDASSRLPYARLPIPLVSGSSTTVTDCNTATDFGLYRVASGTPNMPSGVATTLMMLVRPYSAQFYEQIAYELLTEGESDTKVWRRTMNNSVWSSWYRVRLSQTELDARYAPIASPTFTGAGTFTGYLRFNYNASASYPSTGAGGAFGWNFAGGAAEVDLWNTYTTAVPARAFVFRQLLTSSTQDELFNITSSGVAVPAGRYYNFGTTFGSTGYGFRDNAGTPEVKSSGGAWAAIADKTYVDQSASPGAISGLTLSNNATDATNDIDIAAGAAASDDTTPVLMKRASTLTKRLDAAWAVGSGNGGRDTGSIADGDWHIWLIQRSDTGVVDALFSQSATSPTMPANYDRKRRIGAVIRKAGVILPFKQSGDNFYLLTPVNDVSVTNLGTSRAFYTLTVPAAAGVHAICTAAASHASAATLVVVTSPFQNDVAPNSPTGYAHAYAPNAGTAVFLGLPPILTNGISQIGARSNQTSTTFNVVTVGWTDPRE